MIHLKPNEKTKMLVSVIDIIASLSAAIITQHPYHKTDNKDVLNDILKILNPHFKDKFLGYKEFSDREQLRLFLTDQLMKSQLFKNLNLSAYEIEQGIDVDDPERPLFSFTSRYYKPDPYHDFIDLDALINNVVRNIEWLVK